MAIAHVTSVTGERVDSAITFDVTVSGTDTYMVCGIATQGNTTIGTPTYNGVSMTKVTEIAGGTGSAAARLAIYRLIAPAAGTNEWTVPLGGTLSGAAGVSVYQGVDQTSPEGAVDTDNTNTDKSSVSASPASAVGDLVLDFLSRQDLVSDISPGGSQTERFESDINGAVAWGSSIDGSAGSTSVSASWSGSDRVAYAAFAISPAAGGASTVSVDSQLFYNVRQLLAVDGEFPYTIKNLLAVDVELLNAIRQVAAGDAELIYAIRQLAAADVQLLHAVRQLAAADSQLLYEILNTALVHADLQIPYAMAGAVGEDLAILFGIRALVNASSEIYYRIAGLMTADVELPSAIKGLASSDLQILNGLAGLAPSDLQLLYRVGLVPSGAIERTLKVAAFARALKAAGFDKTVKAAGFDKTVQPHELSSN